MKDNTEIIDTLPETDDGKKIHPGMEVYFRSPGTWTHIFSFTVTSVSSKGPLGGPPWLRGTGEPLFSTRPLAVMSAVKRLRAAADTLESEAQDV